MGETLELHSENFELDMSYYLLTSSCSEAGLGTVQDAEMIWGAMKKCRRSTGATTSSAVTHPNSDL